MQPDNQIPNPVNQPNPMGAGDPPLPPNPTVQPPTVQVPGVQQPSNQPASSQDQPMVMGPAPSVVQPPSPGVMQPTPQPSSMPTMSGAPQNPKPKKSGIKTALIAVGVLLGIGFLGGGGYYAYTMLNQENYSAQQSVTTLDPATKITMPAPLKKIEAEDLKTVGFESKVADKFKNNKDGFTVVDEGVYASYADPGNKKGAAALVYFAIIDAKSLKAELDKINALSTLSGRSELVYSEQKFLEEVRKGMVSGGGTLGDSLKVQSEDDSLRVTAVSEPIPVGDGMEIEITAKDTSTQKDVKGKMGLYLSNDWKMKAVLSLAEAEIWDQNSESFEAVFKSFNTSASSTAFLRR